MLWLFIMNAVYGGLALFRMTDVQLKEQFNSTMVKSICTV